MFWNIRHNAKKYPSAILRKVKTAVSFNWKSNEVEDGLLSVDHTHVSCFLPTFLSRP